MVCPFGPFHSVSRLPTSTGAVHKSVTLRCVLIFVQLNKCVVCGSVLQMGLVVIGVCLRQFGLNMNVGWLICLF